jgi:hypothetical protein
MFGSIIKRILLLLAIFSLSFLVAGCWMTPMAVDSNQGSGFYTSTVNKPVASWIASYDLMSRNWYFPIARDSSDTLYGITNDPSKSSTIRIYTKVHNNGWSSSSYMVDAINPDWMDITADSLSHIHGSFLDLSGDKGLYYGTNALGSFTTYKIATSATGPTRIVVDESGIIHIIATNLSDSTLKHIYSYGGSWLSENVGAGFYSYTHAIATGPGNTIHVALLNSANTTLLYSVKSAGAWYTQTVANNMYLSSWSGIGIAVKSNGSPLIAYYSNESSLLYASRSGSTWSFETVDTSNQAGFNGLSLKLDPNDNPVITYLGDYRRNLQLAQRSASGWIRQSLLSNNTASSIYYTWPFMVINSKGFPEITVNVPYNYKVLYLEKANDVTHISYFNSSIKQVMHGTVNKILSSYESVATTVGNGYSSISLDTAGVPCIAYVDGGNYNLHYARFNNGTWAVETMLNLGGIWGYAGSRPLSLQIGSDNKPQMAFIGGVNGELIYAAKSGSTWSYSTISTVVVEDGVSLALDTGNKPRIAFSWYSTSSYSYLSYACKSGSNWVLEKIGDTTANRTGFWNSIGLDKKGDVYISYRDSSNTDLKIAWKKNGVWKYESIATTGSQGAYNSMAIDKDGIPHIAYGNYSDYTVRYARLIEKTGRRWVKEEIVPFLASEGYTSLALEENLNPAISYLATDTTLAHIRNAQTSYHLPDIKLLNGTGLSTAFNMNLYKISPSHSLFTIYRNGSTAKPSLVAGNRVDFAIATAATGYSFDTIAISGMDSTRWTAPMYETHVKYSDFIFRTKFPRMIFEGVNLIENSRFYLPDYIQQSPLYSGITNYSGQFIFDNPADSGKLSGFVTVSELSIYNAYSPLIDNAYLKFYIRSTTWSDVELIRICPVLNSHSGFTVASDTAQWAYENTDNTTVKPVVFWDNSPPPYGGTPGSLALQFTGVNQGVKMTAQFANWLKTEPNEWYTLRVLVKADGNTPANNNVTLGVYAYNGVPPAETDIAAHLVFTVSTGWKWFEVPLYSSGTSMYPQLLIKNGTTTTVRILVNKWEIIKAKPDTEMVYGTPKVEGATQTFDSSAELNRWAFENMNPALEGVNGAPTYQVRNGELMFDFYDTAYRGIKFTSAVTTGVVRTGAVTPGKGAGMSVKFRSEGSLFYPLVLLAAFGTDSVNKADFKELAAFANIYHINTNKKSEIRFGYVSNMPYVYQQVQIKNGGPSRFFFDEVNLEADQDIPNYWDSTMVPEIFE